MRLGQLSRKINIKSTDIVEFIEKEFNDTIKNHPNCKVPDEYLTSIQSNFLIEDIEDSTHEEEESLDEITTKEPVEITSEPEPTEQQNEADDDDQEEIKHDEPTEKEDKSDSVKDIDTEDNDVHELIIEEGVIKAPKPEVEGIKVVGKIDLPEPNEETSESAEEDNSEGDVEKAHVPQDTPVKKDIDSNREDKNKDKRSPNKKKSNSKSRPSLEEKKKRQEERYKKEQAAKKKREKEKKKENYEKMMKEKSSAPKKSIAKKQKKSNKKPDSQNKVSKDQPKTIWGKFMRWLNT
jgi:hypothetical protein